MNFSPVRRQTVESSCHGFGETGQSVCSWAVACEREAPAARWQKLSLLSPYQVNMMTLAEHIIEATPDRIKRENFVPMESPLVERTEAAAMSTTMSWLASYLADVDHLPSAAQMRSVGATELLGGSELSKAGQHALSL